jgi:hypothetical protein
MGFFLEERYYIIYTWLNSSSGKLISVFPGTLVRVEEREGNNCRVTITDGEKSGTTGWVECDYIEPD